MAELVEAVASTRRDGLVALRDMLARDLEVCDSMRDKAALSLRLMDALEQIEALDRAQPATRGTVLDELAKRRAESKPPARPSRPARRAQ